MESCSGAAPFEQRCKQPVMWGSGGAMFQGEERVRVLERKELGLRKVKQ